MTKIELIFVIWGKAGRSRQDMENKYGVKPTSHFIKKILGLDLDERAIEDLRS